MSKLEYLTLEILLGMDMKYIPMRMSSIEDDVSANTWRMLMDSFTIMPYVQMELVSKVFSVLREHFPILTCPLVTSPLEFSYTPSAAITPILKNRGIMSFGGYTYNTTFFLRYVGGAGFQFYVYPSREPALRRHICPGTDHGVDPHCNPTQIGSVFDLCKWTGSQYK